MSYFKHFPVTGFKNQTITDITKFAKISTIVKSDVMSLLPYTVMTPEKPDDVAFNYYGDSIYSWLVLISNNIVDPYFEWPMSVREFEAYIKKKYGSIAAAQSQTVHCEHVTKNITVSADSLTVSNGVSSSDYNAIDAYTWEDRINENRRFIKLVDAKFISQIEAEMKDLFFNKGSK
jgi:hypothetical protein